MSRRSDKTNWSSRILRLFRYMGLRTQREGAAAIGVSEQELSAWVSETISQRRTPSPVFQRRICELEVKHIPEHGQSPQSSLSIPAQT